MADMKIEERMSPLRISYSVLISALITLSPLKHVLAQTQNEITAAAVPQDNLAYPVLITLKDGAKGSGFFLNTPKSVYLVTAHHVLAETNVIDPQTQLYKTDADIEAISYSKDFNDTHRNVLTINLHDVQQDSHVIVVPSEDIIAVMIGTFGEIPGANEGRPISLVHGVTLREKTALGIVGVPLELVKKLDQSIVGNDVIMYGYPASLGIKQIPQLDPDRALLRKGIIAGKNLQLHSLILDCPVYFGDSGGAVFEADREAFQIHYFLIGVVKEYVPFATTTPTLSILYNSGYSIAVPMDNLLRLIQ
jgi:hypothetical protein